MADQTQDPKESKSAWKSILDAVSSPLDFLQHWSSKSPLLTVLAVVFLLQPVISTSIDLIDELRHVKSDLDPSHRPVTKEELDLVNKKIDFLQQLIVQAIVVKPAPTVSTKPEAKPKERVELASAPLNANIPPTSPPDTMQGIQTELDKVQKKLDDAYVKQVKK